MLMMMLSVWCVHGGEKNKRLKKYIFIKNLVNVCKLSVRGTGDDCNGMLFQLRSSSVFFLNESIQMG